MGSGGSAVPRGARRVWAQYRCATLCLLASVLWTTAVQSQTLRWSSKGDPLTMDPHSQNELLTNNLNGQVYESLVNRDRQLAIVPVLAISWQQSDPLHWRFKLRPNVRFHDGTPFTADDVVFSVLRARDSASDIKAYAQAMGEPRRVDALTVDFTLKQVNPIFLQHLSTVSIMSRWPKRTALRSRSTTRASKRVMPRCTRTAPALTRWCCGSPM